MRVEYIYLTLTKALSVTRLAFSLKEGYYK